MKSSNPIQLKALTLLGLMCWLIPFSIYGLWIHASNLGTTHTESVVIFKDYFPDFLNGRWSMTILSIAFCVLAIAFSLMSLQISGKLWKLLNRIILILSGLLLALNLFSMM